MPKRTPQPELARDAKFEAEIEAMMRRARFRQQVLAGEVKPRRIIVRACHVPAYDVAAHHRWLPPSTAKPRRRS